MYSELRGEVRATQFTLSTILFHFKALFWESIILLNCPPPTCKAYPSCLPYCDTVR